MPLLIAQLGDIHFKANDDAAIARASYIGAAIAAEVAGDTQKVVLAVCGDTAYSGEQSQFEIAGHFFGNVEAAIRSQCPSVPIVRLIVPGNHDCNFTGDQAARDGLLGSINSTDAPADSIVKIVLSPLSAYFDFASTFAGAEIAITKTNEFYYAVSILDGHSILRVHLFNTAWMSSIHEQAGSLHFPLAMIQPPKDRADCSFAIIHHPTHWFSQPHAMRPLRDRISEMASVVLVNHEHVAEAAELTPLLNRDAAATRTVYVSGGVIQDPHDADVCSFNVLAVDVEMKSLRISRYEFRENDGYPYFERSADETVSLSGNELNVGPAGAILRQEMAEFLEDPGAPISHPYRDPRARIQLSDIFLYPDLWELDADHDGRDQKQIKSSKVADEMLATEKALITGGERSGRTSIIKRLFAKAFAEGKVPLYLKGDEIPKNIVGMRKKIRQSVAEQYSSITADQYEQMDRSARVVLIDDVHRMAPAARVRKQLLEELERQFGGVILCGDDLIKLDELSGNDARDSGLWEYRHVVILGFGEYLREELVRQWLMLGGELFQDDEEFTTEVDRICALLNAVIKKQLLPAYPLFLLVILQQSDLATANVQSGSFGKLFEGLMTAILNKSHFTRINIGDKYYYLAALSKKMFDEKAMSLSVGAAKEWHRSYWDEIELEIDFERLTEDLESLGVLTISDTEIRFKYAYCFCFFVAYYLNRTLHDPDTRSLIKLLSRQLHHRISADIVLFLAHLTGDPIVLNEMVNTCDELFSGVTPANLDSDVEPLNRLGNVVETISIPDVPDENRREVKLRKDARVEERLAATTSTYDITAPEADSDAIRRLFDIHAAYKTIQILRQALRNVAGSASKARKEEVIGKIVGLARRVLGVYFEMFAADVLPQVIEEMAAAHKEQQPDLVTSDLHDEVCRHLTGLSQFVSFSIVKHTTFSVGSENLAPTIHRVLADSDSMIARILDLSFELEHPNRFPKDAAIQIYRDLRNNRFSASLVRLLVAHHMYLYVVPIQDRQTVCEKMSINLRPAVLDRSRKRLT